MINNLRLKLVTLLLLSCEIVAMEARAQTDKLPSITSIENTATTQRSQSEMPTETQIKSQFGKQEVQFTDNMSPVRLTDPVKLRQPVITLTGAVEEATNLNKDIARNRFEVARFKWDYIASQAGRLPNVRAISYLAQQTVSGNLAIPRHADAFVFVAALMPITQQYRLGLEARAIRLGESIAQYKLAQEVNDTTAKVKSAYYKLVLDQSKLETLDVAIKYLKELQITTANRVKEGNSLKVEVLQVEAKLAKLVLDQTRARNALQIDRERFNHLLGRNIESDVSLEAIPPPDSTELNLKEAEQRALNRRPEVLGADARMHQINLEKKIRIAEYIPNVSIGAVYIALPGFNNTILPKNTFAPGMFMKYNAFDWGRKAYLAKAQNRSEHAALLNLESIREEVLIDLHTQVNKLSEARLAVKTTEFAREVSLEDLRVAMNRYKFTSDKLAEVLQAQSSLAEANNNYHEALLSFWNAKSEFERATGE